jgi:hypothetical protein
MLSLFKSKSKPIEQDITGVPNNILEEISKLNLKQNQMVVVTLTNRVVTRERSDPKTGEKKLLSTDTSQTHSLSVIQK